MSKKGKATKRVKKSRKGLMSLVLFLVIAIAGLVFIVKVNSSNPTDKVLYQAVEQLKVAYSDEPTDPLEQQVVEIAKAFSRGEIPVVDKPGGNNISMGLQQVEGQSPRPVIAIPQGVDLSKRYGPTMMAIVLVEEFTHIAQSPGLVPQSKEKMIQSEVEAAEMSVRLWDRLARANLLPKEAVSDYDSSELSWYGSVLYPLWLKGDKQGFEREVRKLAELEYDANGQLTEIAK